MIRLHTYNIHNYISTVCYLYNAFVQKVIDDFPPGGFPEYFTEVNDPGPADGASCLASSCCGISSYLASSAGSSSVAKGDLATALGFPPAALDGFAVDPCPILPELPHLSSAVSSCPI